MKKTDVDLDTITSILCEIFQVKQTPLAKADLDNHSDPPSYNTCMRKGLRLNKLVCLVAMILHTILLLEHIT